VSTTVHRQKFSLVTTVVPAVVGVPVVVCVLANADVHAVAGVPAVAGFPSGDSVPAVDVIFNTGQKQISGVV